MRGQPSPYEASFQQEDEIDSIQLAHLKTRTKNAFIAITAFIVVVSSLLLYRYYATADLLQSGRFYQNELLSRQMLPFWKELGEEEEREGKVKIIEEGEHNITRQQLGNMGWTMLHMMTGSFPEVLTPQLVKKWNAFMVLFGQFYPCKVCSTHFLKMLGEVGPFKGTTKEELMVYLCEMHNIVNKRLGKPIHDCSGVKEEWNTCGCSE